RRDRRGERALLAALELAAAIDLERDLARRNAAVSDASFETHAAGRDVEDLAHRLGAQLHLLGGAREPEPDMHHVTARRQYEDRRRRAFFLEHAEDAVGVRL